MSPNPLRDESLSCSRSPNGLNLLATAVSNLRDGVTEERTANFGAALRHYQEGLECLQLTECDSTDEGVRANRMI